MPDIHNQAIALIQMALNAENQIGMQHNAYAVISATVYELRQRNDITMAAAVHTACMAYAEVDSANLQGCHINLNASTATAVTVVIHGKPHVIALRSLVGLIDAAEHFKPHTTH